MKKFLLLMGLVSSAAFALTDAQKRELLNRYMGPTANKVQLGDLVVGGSGAVFVMKAGDTMTGSLRIPNGSASAPSLKMGAATTGLYSVAGRVGVAISGSEIVNVNTAVIVTSDNGVTSGEQQLVRASRGTGGTDAGVFIGYRANGSSAIAGSIRAANSLPLYLGTTGTPGVLQVSNAGVVGITSGLLNFAGNSRAASLVLSGTSTLIANTTVGANTKVLVTGVGASNVAPWLIGISAGVGYAVGATGAGSAHALLIEGQ